jgi:MoxR-like ATPase
MELELKNKIRELLNSNTSSSLINSEEFYFQKAKDALDYFLQLEVTDATKIFLLENRKNYNELKQLFEGETEFSVFGKAILTVISYCDSRADRKSEFNQYDDSRTLAMASVRMNFWVKQLITYKFEGALTNGSIKNAIEYLLKPEANFTMLSENHRSQLSENLFKKRYDKDTFQNDFINFFSGFSIAAINPQNYTHLLTRIIYNLSDFWKESIIGLICPDGTGWQENMIDTPEAINYTTVWNHRKPNIPQKTLKLLKSSIEENGFFRIFYSYDYTVHYVAEVIDFVTNQSELDKADWQSHYTKIISDGSNFSDYNDGSKSASIVYLVNRFYKVEPINESNFIYYANKKYPSVGSQAPVISYKTNLEIQKQNKMKNQIDLLHYKKQIILQGPPGTGKTRLAKKIAKKVVENNKISNATISVKTLSKNYIKSNLNVGQKIEGKNDTIFEVVDLGKNVVLIKSETSKPWRPSYNKIIDSFNNRLWKIRGRTGGFKSYEDAIAKYFYENHLNSINEEEQSISNVKDFQKIIQFHPSYTYEDFVRGIVAKPNEEAEGIIYEAENKTIAKFAEDALNDSDNNYVLIIDEINRANLSSVLGELIYALEYRGEEVESMYEVDGSQKLILPPNLYIIGTMNTADRSVGHIDYAIRRRFAFVDILPKKLNNSEEIIFNHTLYESVSKLFVKDFNSDTEYNAENIINNETYLSSEFNAKDVWLGHSYFIQKIKKDGSGNIIEKNPAEMSTMLDYEIKPILMEYVRDGVLKPSAIEVIKNLSV